MFLYKKIDKQVISEVAEETVFTECYDVIVVGLGTAGAIAAITAAKMGQRVLGIESSNCMGGQGTGGRVFIYYLGQSGGIYEEIDQECMELEQTGFAGTNEDYVPHGVNPDIKKYILEKRAVKEGVHISYDSLAVGVYTQEKKVMGILWLHQGELKSTSGKIILDCTADACLCEMLDGSMLRGRTLDHQCQPYSSVMTTLSGEKISCRYTDCGYADQYDGDMVSELIINSNTLPLHLRSNYGTDDQIVAFSGQFGSREGKCITGGLTITLEDILGEKAIGKALFYAYSNIDVHGKDMAFESGAQQYWSVVCGLWGIKIMIPIPLEALVPNGYDGILAAGRHISVDHDIASAVRMKRDIQKCGEAAAVAAALAIRENCPVLEIDYDTASSILKESGCLSAHTEEEASFFDESNYAISWLTDAEAIKEALSTEKPGIALWSIKRQGDRMLNALETWLQEDSYHLRRNSALALGMLGNRKAIPALRDMVKRRDAFCFKNSKMYTQPRGIAAIFLLGELEDEGSISILKDIMESSKSFEHMEVKPNELIEDWGDLYFQFYTFALMALIKIGNRRGNHRGYIKTIIRNSMKDEACRLYINLKDGNGLRYDMKKKVNELAERGMEEWG